MGGVVQPWGTPEHSLSWRLQLGIQDHRSSLLAQRLFGGLGSLLTYLPQIRFPTGTQPELK